tara:strand:+ start:175 stop:999 length:825 start_codon:yes stop_codon:yes gene_type:complete
MENYQENIVKDFGNEWNLYKQDDSKTNFKEIFSTYFSIFPKNILNKESVGFDAGCGSGRWAKFVAPQVKELTCLDPSEKALNIAKNNLSKFSNCLFECSTIDNSRITENSQDFGYCLGVLHHIPNTKKAMKSCVSKLKKNAPLLIYLYYKFDNKPLWFKGLWLCTDLIRRIISKMPFFLKVFLTKLIAITIYYPLAKISFFLDFLGLDTSNIPLSQYRNYNFYVLATDALDRFGTKLEKRFTQKEIKEMMSESGLTSIEFRKNAPYWVAIGYKK